MMTATSAAASSLPPVRTSYHVPLSLMASISEETISLWLKLGALEKLEQAVLDGYGDQLCGKTSRIPQVNKFLRQVPLFQSKIKDIHRAVSQGRLRDVQHLIDRKKLAFCRDQSGATPLHKAVIFGHQDLIEYLVGRYGGVIHVRDHQGRTPLHYAAFLPDGGEIYQFLLASGADERAMDVCGRQPSHYVDGQNENTLRQLREGTGINGMRKMKSRYYNQSPGNKAQENGTKHVVSKMQVRELISEGNLDTLEDLVLQGHGDRLLGETSKDSRVQTFLNIVPVYMERIYDIHRAVMRDQLEHVVILLENRRLAMARDQLGATPLHKAVWFGHYKIAHFISHHFPETLNTLDLEGRTPLHYAAALRDNKHMYGIIADADANKSIFDNKGKTADYYMQYPEHLNLDEVIKRCHKVNANYLANTANRIKGKSPTRQTPPPSNGSSSSPRSDDNNGSSKESGISGENGTEAEQMFAMLQKDTLAKRVDICSANIHRWIQNRDVEKLERAVMEGYGEKVIKIQGDNDISEQSADDMILSAKMSQMVQTVNAIHSAVSNDDVSELQTQVNHKDYILAKDHMGMTPLHRSVLLGRTNVLKYLIDKFPETVNVKNKEGRTALHYAAAMSRKDGQNLYKMLVQGGADSRVRDNHGRTADYYKTHLLTLPNKTPKVRVGNGVPTRHSEPLNRYSKQGVLERMTVALQRGNVDLLQELVLEGHGRHLIGKASWNDDVKQFLKDLPNYLAKIQNLHSAVSEGRVEVMKGILNGDEKLLKARDENGACPIHIGAQMAQAEVMSYLMFNFPSTLNYKDGIGRTAMHIACQDGNSTLYKFLKDAGADYKILDQKGRTAEFYLQNAKGDSHPYKLNGNLDAPKKLIEEKQPQANEQQPRKSSFRGPRDKRSLEQPGNIRKTEAVQRSRTLNQRRASTTKAIGILDDKNLFDASSLKIQPTVDEELDDNKPQTRDDETYDDSFDDDDTGENDEGKSEDSDHIDKKVTSALIREQETREESSVEGNKGEVNDGFKSADQETPVANGIFPKKQESVDKENSDFNISDKSDNIEEVLDIQHNGFSDSIDTEILTAEQNNQEAKSEELSLQTEKEDEKNASALENIKSEENDATNGDNADAAVDNADAAIDNADAAIDNADAAIDNADAAIDNADAVIDNDDAVIDNADAIIDNADAAIDNADAAIDNADAVIDNADAVIDNADAAIDNADAAIDNADAAIDNDDSAIDNDDVAIDNDDVAIDNADVVIDNADIAIDNADVAIDNDDDATVHVDTTVNVEETGRTVTEVGSSLSNRSTPIGRIESGNKVKTDIQLQNENDDVNPNTEDKAKEEITHESEEPTPEIKNQEGTDTNENNNVVENPEPNQSEEDSQIREDEGLETNNEKKDIPDGKEDRVNKEISQETGEEGTPPGEETKSPEESQEQANKENEETQDDKTEERQDEKTEDEKTEETQDAQVEEAQDTKAEEEQDTETENDNTLVEKDGNEKAPEEDAEKDENKNDEQVTEENKSEETGEIKAETTETETSNKDKAEGEESREDANDKSATEEGENNDDSAVVQPDEDKPPDSETTETVPEEKESDNQNADAQNDEKDNAAGSTNEPEIATQSKPEDDSEQKSQVEEEQKVKKDEKIEEHTHQTKDHLDELIEHWIKEGDLLRLEHVVLAGQGDRLIERTSEDKQVQDFLDLVPIYMAKIRAVHEAVVKGQLRDVRSILTRKRFALSRDHVGASPLHLAVLHGHSDVATYIISHFPETMDGPDNEGRTPLHYASALPDNGALYKILKVAGADENIEDKSGHSPKYYFNHHGDLTLSELLEPYMSSE